WPAPFVRGGTVEYASFIASKRRVVQDAGFTTSQESINPLLFDFQRDIVRWALRKGRSAIFAGTGLGKTAMQLEWARHVHEHTGHDVLILAPLAVAEQTVREGQKFGITVTHARTADDVRGGINITNYERLHLFDPDAFAGIVLDESSILKSYDGA